MRIVVDFDVCESNALCVRAAPSTFALNEDDTLEVLDPEPGEALRAQVVEAARRCPKQAIRVDG